MNLIFISPNFPVYYYNFCERLKTREVNVLGIGDQSYDTLPEETKNSLTEYYKVDSLENYDEVFKATAYFAMNYGKIDWIESQNEYWLEMEADLRTDFNVTTGKKASEMPMIKYKSKMKEVYKSIGIPCAKYILLSDYDSAKAFCDQVGYPVIVKPDNGVGASSTYKINDEEELQLFFKEKEDWIQFILEECVPGHVETFDGITNSKMEPLVCTSHVMLNSIMDNVNEGNDTAFYSQPTEGLDLTEIGKKALVGFNAVSRFFHFEFFRLDENKKGLGKKGDIVGLEVNMRAPGAYMPEMMNYAYDTDVYTIWADMIKFDKCFLELNRKYWVAYTGRRDGVPYLNSDAGILTKFNQKIKLSTDVPEALSAAMGNHVYITVADSKEELFQQIRYILKRADGTEWM